MMNAAAVEVHVQTERRRLIYHAAEKGDFSLFKKANIKELTRTCVVHNEIVELAATIVVYHGGAYDYMNSKIGKFSKSLSFAHHVIHQVFQSPICTALIARNMK